nr:alpha/beta family hydrolase [Frankia sp. Cppng1_Ct_nod]
MVNGDMTSLEVDGGRMFVVPAVGTPIGLVVLLHGAGSGTDVGVLSELAARLPDAGVSVARLEMPYRVAGRRAPDRPARLDAVLRTAMGVLPHPRPVVLVGRSMGSRVACRCAREIGAVGVVAFGFPLFAPRGTLSPGVPAADRPSRLPELLAAGVRVLVVQGDRDAFGMPDPDPARHIEVYVLHGADHAMRTRRRDGRTEADVINEASAVGADWIHRRLLQALDGVDGP